MQVKAANHQIWEAWTMEMFFTSMSVAQWQRVRSLVRFPWSACRSVLWQDTEPQIVSLHYLQSSDIINVVKYKVQYFLLMCVHEKKTPK